MSEQEKAQSVYRTAMYSAFIALLKDMCMDDIHTMPNNDKHECSVKCFCNPELYYEDELTKKRVWLHKSEEELNQ